MRHYGSDPSPCGARTDRPWRRPGKILQSRSPALLAPGNPSLCFPPELRERVERASKSRPRFSRPVADSRDATRSPGTVRREPDNGFSNDSVCVTPRRICGAVFFCLKSLSLFPYEHFFSSLLVPTLRLLERRSTVLRKFSRNTGKFAGLDLGERNEPPGRRPTLARF